MNNNIINTIIKNKNQILSAQKKEDTLQKQEISQNVSPKIYEKEIKEAYIIMKKDNNIKILEKKFNIKWTKENINLL